MSRYIEVGLLRPDSRVYQIDMDAPIPEGTTPQVAAVIDFHRLLGAEKNPEKIIQGYSNFLTSVPVHTVFIDGVMPFKSENEINLLLKSVGRADFYLKSLGILDSSQESDQSVERITIAFYPDKYSSPDYGGLSMGNLVELDRQEKKELVIPITARVQEEANRFILTFCHELGHGAVEKYLNNRLDENIDYRPYHNQTHPLLDEGAMEVLKAVITASQYFSPSYHPEIPESLITEIIRKNPNFHYSYLKPWCVGLIHSNDVLLVRPITDNTVWAYRKIKEWVDGGIVSPEDFNRLIDLINFRKEALDSPRQKLRTYGGFPYMPLECTLNYSFGVALFVILSKHKEGFSWFSEAVYEIQKDYLASSRGQLDIWRTLGRCMDVKEKELVRLVQEACQLCVEFTEEGAGIIGDIERSGNIFDNYIEMLEDVASGRLKKEEIAGKYPDTVFTAEQLSMAVSRFKVNLEIRSQQLEEKIKGDIHDYGRDIGLIR